MCESVQRTSHRCDSERKRSIEVLKKNTQKKVENTLKIIKCVIHLCSIVFPAKMCDFLYVQHATPFLSCGGAINLFECPSPRVELVSCNSIPNTNDPLYQSRTGQ